MAPGMGNAKCGLGPAFTNGAGDEEATGGNLQLRPRWLSFIRNKDEAVLFQYIRKPRKPTPQDTGAYLPTPEEIATTCREIQSGWTPETEEDRRTIAHKPWSAPMVAVEALPEDADE